MKKRTKGKGSASVLLNFALGTILTLGFTVLSAKLILSGTLNENGIDLYAGITKGIVALVLSLLTARRSPQRKILWGLFAVALYYLLLIICNLLFFGIAFSGVLQSALWIMGGGLLGSLLGNKKVRKYA